MRILLFIVSLKMGGSEKACVRLANALSKKHEVTIQTLFGGGMLVTEVSPHVHVRHVFPRFIRGIALVSGWLPARLVHWLYVKGEYDAEIAVGNCLESHVISGSTNPRRFSWIHMVIDWRIPPDVVRCFAKFHRIICVSETTKAAFIKNIGYPEKCVIAYTPIDSSIILRKSEEHMDVPNNRMLLAVGRLEYIKGFDRLLEAVNKLQRKDFHLTIVGNGTQRKALEQQILDYGLVDRVTLVGMLANPYPLMRMADALICPSRSESFGFVGLEAMLLGTPVIATRCGGYEEIMTSPELGLLCENTTEGIKQALNDWLSGRHIVNTEAARQRAEYFCTSASIGRFSQLLEE